MTMRADIQYLAHMDEARTLSSMYSEWTVSAEVMIIDRNTETPEVDQLFFELFEEYSFFSQSESFPIPDTQRSESSSRWCVLAIKSLRYPFLITKYNSGVWYHVLAFEQFRPFVAFKKQCGSISWSSSAKLPEAVYAAPVRQLKCRAQRHF